MIPRLRAYIEPVDSEWFQKLKPASEENIEQWKKKLKLEDKGVDFPPTYLEFYDMQVKEMVVFLKKLLG